MLKWISKWFGVEPLPAKDPTDWTLTESSTKWWKGTYCPECKAGIGYPERVTGVCDTCGTRNSNFLNYQRLNREIWNGSKWVIQRRYSDDSYILEDKK